MTDPWFKFFPSDWISGVSSLSAAERGVYVTILAMIYDHKGPVPRNDSRIARSCGLPKVGLTRAVDALLALGKLVEIDGALFNERAKRELTERENRTVTASENATSRWQKTQQYQTSSDTKALPAKCEPNAIRARLPEARSQIEDSSESSSSSAPSTEPAKGPETTFASKNRDAEKVFETVFWPAWPNKVAKPEAKRAFVKVASEVSAIMAGVARYITDKPADRSWMHPATFLNGRRWEDAPAAMPRAGPNGSLLPFPQSRQDAQHGSDRSASSAARRQLEAIKRGDDPFAAIRARRMPAGGSEFPGGPDLGLLPEK